MTDQKRIFYLDNLKVFLIILVIVHHVGQAYGSTGGAWFYSYPGERVRIMGLFFWFNASFFMGLFFFISGYLFPLSHDRHGAGKFIVNKLVRFGIPLIFGVSIMVPVLNYLRYYTYAAPVGFKDFYFDIWLNLSGDAPAPQYGFSFAHLWFIQHLLLYAILYSFLGWLLPRIVPSFSNRGPKKVGLYSIAIYIFSLGLVTHILRVGFGFSMDRWIGFLGFIQMEPAHMPQYFSLFILGILACRWSFLESITGPRDIYWLIPGLGIYALIIVLLFIAGPKAAFFDAEFSEALLCVGVCIGLLALFRKYFNRTGPVMKALSGNVYGMYILHVPVVVALQYAFDPVNAGALTLFMVVSVLSITGTFLVSYLVRLVPGMKRII